MQVAILTRVSTEGQELANQLRELRRFATSQGWEVVAEFADVASGADPSRPGLAAALEAASRHEYDVLLFWSLDRLSREGARRTLEILGRLDSYQVKFRSYTEPYLDSIGPFGEAVVAILAAIARQERLRLGERVRAGMARAKTAGTRSGRPIGRPPTTVQPEDLAALLHQGYSLRRGAAALRISRGLAWKLAKVIRTASTNSPEAATKGERGAGG